MSMPTSANPRSAASQARDSPTYPWPRTATAARPSRMRSTSSVIALAEMSPMVILGPLDPGRSARPATPSGPSAGSGSDARRRRRHGPEGSIGDPDPAIQTRRSPPSQSVVLLTVSSFQGSTWLTGFSLRRYSAKGTISVYSWGGAAGGARLDSIRSARAASRPRTNEPAP